MIYRIAVCEDKGWEAEALAGMIRTILNEQGIAYRLEIYGSCRELFTEITKKKKSYHLLFLDILMDGLTGMEFAKKLRKFNQQTSIVFVTVTMEYVLEGYTVRAIRYLHKPVKPEELRSVLYEDYAMRFRHIAVRLEGGERRIRLHELFYMESRGHKVVCYLHSEVLEAVPLEGSFSAMAEKLPGELVRCHRCYIVNTRLIRELNRNTAILENGTSLPIGRKWFNQVQDAYLNLAELGLYSER